MHHLSQNQIAHHVIFTTDGFLLLENTVEKFRVGVGQQQTFWRSEERTKS